MMFLALAGISLNKSPRSIDDDRELPRRAPEQTTKDNRMLRRVQTNVAACAGLLELGPEREMPVEDAVEN